MQLAPIITLCTLLFVRVQGRVGFTMTQGTPDGNYIRFAFVPTNMQAQVTKEVGAFRCSLPGLYQFTFAAMAPSGQSFRISLRKNRVPVVTAYGSDNGFSWASNAALLYLLPNDLVYLFLEEGQIYESTVVNRAFTSFTGHLVSGDNLLMGRNAVEEELGFPDPKDHIFDKMPREVFNGTISGV